MKIKFVVICIFLFSGLIETSAQSKFSIGLSSGYLENYRVITENESDLYKDYRNENEGFISGFDTEVNLLYNFRPKLYFETGIGYIQKGYKINEEVMIDPCYSPVTCGYYSELYRYTYDYLSIPFHFIYTTSGRLNYSLSIGTSALIPLSSNVDWILRKELGSVSGQKIDTRKNTDSNKFNMTLDIGIGMGYRLSKKLNLIVLPKLNYNIFAYENTDIRDKRYNISKFINEDKASKEHLISYGIGVKLLYELGKRSH